MVRGKGRDCADEFVVLSAEALEPIRQYLDVRQLPGLDEPLFDARRCTCNRRLSTRAIRKIVSKYLIRAGLKSRHITAHSLRHTSITLAIQGGGHADLVQVQQMAKRKHCHHAQILP